MASRAAVTAALGLAALSLVSGEDLSVKKVHLMSTSASGNFLFRGNMPVVTTNGSKAFAYAELLELFAQRAAAANVTFPSTIEIDIYSFDNIFDVADTIYESEYAAAHPSEVNVTFWPLVGQLLSPAIFSPTTQQELVTNGSSLLWVIDQLPTRVAALNAMLQASYDVPRAFYIHCEAGCDRTGEFSASWYMQYEGYNQTGAIARDTVECGRAPYTVSIQAAQWYCLWLGANAGVNAGPCY